MYWRNKQFSVYFLSKNCLEKKKLLVSSISLNKSFFFIPKCKRKYVKYDSKIGHRGKFTFSGNKHEFKCIIGLLVKSASGTISQKKKSRHAPLMSKDSNVKNYRNIQALVICKYHDQLTEMRAILIHGAKLQFSNLWRWWSLKQFCLSLDHIRSISLNLYTFEFGILAVCHVHSTILLFILTFDVYMNPFCNDGKLFMTTHQTERQAFWLLSMAFTQTQWILKHFFKKKHK